MEFSNVGHGKSWKSHGILQLLRCMNPVGLIEQIQAKNREIQGLEQEYATKVGLIGQI